MSDGPAAAVAAPLSDAAADTRYNFVISLTSVLQLDILAKLSHSVIPIGARALTSARGRSIPADTGITFE